VPTSIPSALLITAALIKSATITPPGDACSLFTKEEAAAALGEAANGPKAIAEMDAGQGATVTACEYTGSGYHRVQLNLTRLPASSLPMYKGMCAKANNDGLAGLGDVACWYNEKHAELHVIKGNAFVSIELNRSGDPTEAIKGLMKKAVSRLK
jgi:hypothetical protein